MSKRAWEGTGADKGLSFIGIELSPFRVPLNWCLKCVVLPGEGVDLVVVCSVNDSPIV